MIVPVWYVGTQLPPSCTNNKQRKRNINDGYEADDENQRYKINKRKLSSKKSNIQEDDEDNDKKRQKLEKEEMGQKFRRNVRSLALSEEILLRDVNEIGFRTSDNDGSNEEEDSDESCEWKEWEHYSDFEFASDNSDSDWM